MWRLSQADANAAQGWSFADAVVTLRERHRGFVAGDGVEENFDTLIERLFSEDELPDNLRVSDRASRKKPKVLRALWAARNRSCPPVIDDVFATVRAVAQGAPLDP